MRISSWGEGGVGKEGGGEKERSRSGENIKDLSEQFHS